jgi:hypothetical protein
MARKPGDPTSRGEPTRRMHQTTLRFGPDLWDALSEEAREAGVSVAQFVREAALARLAYTAGRRGDLSFERALQQVGADTGSEAEPMRLAGQAHKRR